MQLSLDIVIPSFRLDEAVLSRILLLKHPENVKVSFYLISDNPAVSISESLLELIHRQNVNLIINKTNLGFSRTRNIGIDAGDGEWILLLDDDIEPDENLLFIYAESIKQNFNALGFAGATKFPHPFNDVTKALYLNGSVGHFSPTKSGEEIAWTPTANVILNRKKLGKRRFNPHLVKGGEDIELLSRNSQENQQRYFTLPKAFVIHPWWDNGRSQLRRMYRYGQGIGDIIDLPFQKSYTYYDFTSTIETVFLCISLAIFSSIFLNNVWPVTFTIIIGVISAEAITNVVKCYKLNGKKVDLGLAFQMMLHKNAFEVGLLISVLSQRKFNFLFKRLDVSFKKRNPSPFRLNRWKIIKLSLISVILIAYFLIKL